jgi:hypothetical protein
MLFPNMQMWSGAINLFYCSKLVIIKIFLWNWIKSLVDLGHKTCLKQVLLTIYITELPTKHCWLLSTGDLNLTNYKNKSWMVLMILQSNVKYCCAAESYSQSSLGEWSNFWKLSLMKRRMLMYIMVIFFKILYHAWITQFVVFL